ncbi:unnamed protein product [Hydatigera taeniaeformis]|uniref:Basic proline-rich protein n=1 Tax=Hydatigena taeniaeformis TaxID=6205 RepID=A0A0R3X4L3_HYDTA|nr:unnamed protein product [Hydatigera taeniaeformis]
MRPCREPTRERAPRPPTRELASWRMEQPSVNERPRPVQGTRPRPHGPRAGHAESAPASPTATVRRIAGTTSGTESHLGGLRGEQPDPPPEPLAVTIAHEY